MAESSELGWFWGILLAIVSRKWSGLAALGCNPEKNHRVTDHAAREAERPALPPAPAKSGPAGGPRPPPPAWLASSTAALRTSGTVASSPTAAKYGKRPTRLLRACGHPVLLNSLATGTPLPRRQASPPYELTLLFWPELVAPSNRCLQRFQLLQQSPTNLEFPTIENRAPFHDAVGNTAGLSCWLDLWGAGNSRPHPIWDPLRVPTTGSQLAC